MAKFEKSFMNAARAASRSVLNRKRKAIELRNECSSSGSENG
jgi:hypothetical protein